MSADNLSEAAAQMGRKGGQAGTGKAKARSSAQARAAVQTRWAKSAEARRLAREAETERLIKSPELRRSARAFAAKLKFLTQPESKSKRTTKKVTKP